MKKYLNKHKFDFIFLGLVALGGAVFGRLQTVSKNKAAKEQLPKMEQKTQVKSVKDKLKEAGVRKVETKAEKQWRLDMDKTTDKVFQSFVEQEKKNQVAPAKVDTQQTPINWGSPAVKAQLREDVCRFFYNEVYQFEGQKNYIHLCTAYCKTVGRGCNVDKWEDFVKLDFPSPNGGLMSIDEKRALFDRLEAEQNKIREERQYANCDSSVYETLWSPTNGFPRPTPQSVAALELEKVYTHYDLLNHNLKEGLGRNISHFVTDNMFRQKNYKGCLLIGMLDVQYNTGAFHIREYPLCYGALKEASQAYENNDMEQFRMCIDRAAEQSGRSDRKHNNGKTSKGLEERNRIVAGWFRSCTELNCSPDTKETVTNVYKKQVLPASKSTNTR